MSLEPPASSFLLRRVALPFAVSAGGLVLAIAYAAQYNVDGLLHEAFLRQGGCGFDAPDSPECPGAFAGVRLGTIQGEAMAKAGFLVGAVTGIVGRGAAGLYALFGAAAVVGLYAAALRLLPEISDGLLFFLGIALLTMTPGYVVARVAARGWKRAFAGRR